MSLQPQPLSEPNPAIILYDLASTKNICFSPVVWRIRLLLNYKRIPYKTLFLQFPDIEPTLKNLGIVPGEEAQGRYTVPTIYHVPTSRYMMDSTPIAQFLEDMYPEPAVPLRSDLGVKIEMLARRTGGRAFRTSLVPRELHILSPGRVQTYFRTTREAALGCSLESLLEEGKEEEVWESVWEGMEEVSHLLLTNRSEGMFVLGANPSLTDFFIAGSLQSARVIGGGVFERMVALEGYRRVYEGCEVWMGKRD